MKIRRLLLILGVIFLLSGVHVFAQTTTFSATASGPDAWGNVWINGWIYSPPPEF